MRHPITIARQASGLSQAQLASRLGVYELEVAGWESGAHYPEPPVAVRLARMFGLSLQEVYRSVIDADVATRRRTASPRRGTRQVPVSALREAGRLTQIPVPHDLALEASR